ncbi:lipoate--protein ligase family protein [Paenibacillus lupini]|uniref:lipoate--protein ligase family protein n=1 Tax=Paenibacillus lupini TaxID=1450204 RepID=UPI001423EBB6|nr:lipoate--protein ligase family protein [Paenibacillus lupini]NIK25807.1 octanoyl-[GcvH]:protein N-octanoyltransferase [Paenibacillus lupini]
MKWSAIEQLGERSLILLDRMNDFSEEDPLYAFALDELLCRSTGRGGPAVCHVWRHPRAFIMGLRDSRLPGAGAARNLLETAGWATAVRNSGGAAVPLDTGVVNLSLILPKSNAMDFHFHNNFEQMYELIRLALQGSGKSVDKGEITGAYCPGDFDLSIGGYKFCGIAQRRQAQAIVVQAFIVAEGSGAERARLVRSFYNQAAAGADPELYPLVVENSMASLEELAGLGSEAAHVFADAVKQVIADAKRSAGITAETSLILPSAEQIREMTETLHNRYAI